MCIKVFSSHLALQRVHKFEVMVTRKAEGKTGKAFIGNMTEEKSVELASKIASESFLFVVSKANCPGVSHLLLAFGNQQQRQEY